MNSKEALEKLNNLIWREKHINSERNKIVNDCVNQIKQDLERLEMLEQSNNTLAKITGNQLATIHILIEENEKLKKALDVFVKHLQIEWGLQESWLQFRNGDDQSDDLEPEEHKLLKEVSENKL